MNEKPWNKFVIAVILGIFGYLGIIIIVISL